MIREVILGGGIIYLLILFIQVVQRPSLEIEALAAGSLLAVAAAFYWYQRHEGLHRAEAIALWAAVLLFVFYGIMKFAGVV